MSFLLDTNVPSELMNHVPDARVSAWTASHDDFCTSVICTGEITFGIHLLPAGRRRQQVEERRDQVFLPLFGDNILPITKSIADRWGAIAALRKHMGRPINPPDGLIAATALEHGLILVTRDVTHFENLGLTILNPWEIA
jgi:predicted nucleic acid-binding protein